MPIDSSDGGCDWNSVPATTWTRENKLIYIDNEKDFIIADNKTEAWNLYAHLGLRHVVYVGVALNMCVLHRNFAVEQAWRWGLQPLFNRDGIDAMYNPLMRPYVDHWEGTDLMVGYVESFWAPSMSMYDLLDPTATVTMEVEE
mmetsp:Transcript_51596/g.121081  ORF Transcript_51596/g.121081 Transcript_51596/m.121081 type:complete len:143 (-) Transcript_51596:24-452(-)